MRMRDSSLLATQPYRPHIFNTPVQSWVRDHGIQVKDTSIQVGSVKKWDLVYSG